MKKTIIYKILTILLILACVLTMAPSLVRASNEVEGVILEKTNGDKLIYLKGMDQTEFKYAFSDTNDSSGLAFITATKDSNDEYAATLESGNTSQYMFILVESNEYSLDLSTAKSISESEVSQLEALTEIINVTTDEKQSTVTNKDGVEVTTTVGKVVIKDEGNYQYELIEIVDTNDTVTTPNETAVELYNKISELENLNKMYDKISAYITIRDNYNSLKENADWKDAQNNEILQPEDSQNEEKFLVLIKEKGEDGKDDIQIMTCTREDVSDVNITQKEETKVVEKRAELPITGENVAIYIALGVIVLAIIILVIKIKKAKANRDEN